MIQRLKIKVRQLRSWLRRLKAKRQMAKYERDFRRNRRKQEKQWAALVAVLPFEHRKFLDAWISRMSRQRSLTYADPLISVEEEHANWAQLKCEAAKLTEDELLKSGVAHMMLPVPSYLRTDPNRLTQESERQ